MRHPFRFTLLRIWDRLYRDRWLLLAIAALSLMFALLRMSGQSQVPSHEVLPENDNPHLNPACSPRGSKTSVACRCLGMTVKVQSTLAKECWQDAGYPGPPPEIKGVEPPKPPPEVLACMGKIPAHCDIITGFAYDRIAPNKCGTRCHRDRCGCADEGCPAESHGSGEDGSL